MQAKDSERSPSVQSNTKQSYVNQALMGVTLSRSAEFVHTKV